MAQLTENDHKLLDRFLGTALDRYKGGERTRLESIGDIARLLAAVDLIRGAGDSARAYMESVLKEANG